MTPQARAIWDALEFRMPTVLEKVGSLTDAELYCQPPNGANSIAWLRWHIAEVEDNWVRAAVLHLPRRTEHRSAGLGRRRDQWRLARRADRAPREPPAAAGREDVS